MYLVDVLYNEVRRTDRARAFTPYEPGDPLRYVKALVIDADTVEAALAKTWRAMNRVDGSAVEKVPDGERSLSVGDVVVVDGTAYAVAPTGWAQVDRAPLVGDGPSLAAVRGRMT